MAATVTIQIEISREVNIRLVALAKAEKRSKKSMAEWIVENFIQIKEESKK